MSGVGGHNPETTNDAPVKIIRDDLRAMDQKGVKLLHRGLLLRRVAILVFAAFAILALVWK